MSELFCGISSVEKRRFQHWIFCEGALDARGKDTAACLGLKILTAANMVGV